jgi:Icc-related predicted phosphoesterase
MLNSKASFVQRMLVRRLRFSAFVLFSLLAVAGYQINANAAPNQPVDLRLPVAAPFRFIAFGDTRFTDPRNTEAANPAVRQALVKAIADEHPAFISIGGDITYKGGDVDDWKVWDYETRRWRDESIPVYPAIGNHDLKGNEQTALSNYFARFPELQQNRYYSVRIANCLMLVLDSALDEVSGPQGEWVRSKLDAIPADVSFVIVVMHHPPYTSSSDAKKYGGGHSARPSEQAFAHMLETRQQQTHARFVVFTGHIHNYERHEHGGIAYFVTGGGGAHAYPIERAPDDKFQSNDLNYHYLLAQVDHDSMKVTMHRLQLSGGKPTWSTPDTVEIAVPPASIR